MQGIVGFLAVWDEDRSQPVECTSKEGSKEFNRVGKIDGNAISLIFLDVLAYGIDLPRYFTYSMLDSVRK